MYSEENNVKIREHYISGCSHVAVGHVVRRGGRAGMLDDHVINFETLEVKNVDTKKTHRLVKICNDEGLSAAPSCAHRDDEQTRKLSEARAAAQKAFIEAAERLAAVTADFELAKSKYASLLNTSAG